MKLPGPGKQKKCEFYELRIYKLIRLKHFQRNHKYEWYLISFLIT